MSWLFSPRACENCGNKLKRSDEAYCSTECSFDAIRSNIKPAPKGIAKKIGPSPTPEPDNLCEGCGIRPKYIQRSPSSGKVVVHPFCSRSCSMTNVRRPPNASRQMQPARPRGATIDPRYPGLMSPPTERERTMERETNPYERPLPERERAIKREADPFERRPSENGRMAFAKMKLAIRNPSDESLKSVEEGNPNSMTYPCCKATVITVLSAPPPFCPLCMLENIQKYVGQTAGLTGNAPSASAPAQPSAVPEQNVPAAPPAAAPSQPSSRFVADQPLTMDETFRMRLDEDDFSELPHRSRALPSRSQTLNLPSSRDQRMRRRRLPDDEDEDLDERIYDDNPTRIRAFDPYGGTLDEEDEEDTRASPDGVYDRVDDEVPFSGVARQYGPRLTLDDDTEEPEASDLRRPGNANPAYPRLDEENDVDYYDMPQSAPREARGGAW